MSKIIIVAMSCVILNSCACLNKKNQGFVSLTHTSTNGSTAFVETIEK